MAPFSAMDPQRITATYLIETPLDVEEAAAVLAGEQSSGLRLRDFDVPDSFTGHFAGPRFGVAGTRRLTAVSETRPLVGTIVKPSVGMSPMTTQDDANGHSQAE